jgi:hypothetical protein
MVYAMQHDHQFISEPIRPERGTSDATAMARGEPGLPGAFVWRDERFPVTELLETWISTGEDRGETYLRRHWYRFRTRDDATWQVYCLRQGKPGSARWWLYAVEPAGKD